MRLFQRLAGACLVALIPATGLALTCPTHFTHNKFGYWVSSDYPGWESQQTTDSRDSIVAQSFEGAVASSPYKRIACIYRSSKGRQVPLVSKHHLNIRINPHSRNDKKHWAWHWNRKPKDYTCGLPDSTHIEECQFFVDRVLKTRHLTQHEKNS